MYVVTFAGAGLAKILSVAEVFDLALVLGLPTLEQSISWAFG